MSRLHLADEVGGLAHVPGHRAELLDLVVHPADDGGRRALPVVDAERVELSDQVGVGPIGDHKVGLVTGDRLDVRLVCGQVGDDTGRLLRKVGQTVDGDDLVAGADGEQHLGVGRRERDDPARDLARRRRRGRGAGGRRGRSDRPCGRLDAGGGFRRCGIVVVVATCGEQQHSGERAGEDGLHTFLHLVGGQESGSVTAVRPCLEGLVVARRARRPDSSPPPGGFTVAGQCRDLTGLRWVLRPGER